MRSSRIGLLVPFFLAGCAHAPGIWNPEAMLKELVETNSGTANRAGVNAIQERVARRLAELGFATSFAEPGAGQGVTGKMLVARLDGARPETITLLMHADTVFETSSGFLVYTRSADGKTARGPGVIDDKGGIVVALDGLTRYLKLHPKPGRSLEVLVSPAEETGSTPFIPFFRDRAKRTWMVLSFEPGRIDGSIVKARKGNRWYEIRVIGKEAHSGKDHRDGVNACLELSRKVAKISALTDYARDVTTSIGHFEGGQDKFNVVCGTASAKIDTRFMSLASRDRMHAAIAEILAKPEVRAANGGQASRIEYRIVDDSPPLEATPASRPYLEKYLAAIAKVEGRRPEALATGGTGDANEFGGEDAIILDGLGPTGDHMHTAEEFIELPSLTTRSEAFASFLDTVDREAGLAAPRP